MTDQFEPPADMEFMIGEQTEIFPDLPALAARLGVPKHDGTNAAIVLRMVNGDSYSLFAIVNAILDRIDQWEAKYGMGLSPTTSDRERDAPENLSE